MGRPAKVKKPDEDFDDNVDMTKKDNRKIAAMGGNIQGLHEDIRGSYEKIEQWKKERKAINDKIKAEREGMEAKGITKSAFDDAMHYVNNTPEKREGYDTAYIIAREALGAPVKGAQAELDFGKAVTGAEAADDQESE